MPVHRHAPHNGLGSTTCIQNAFNLAWKMAYALKNRADPSLLSPYNEERQPVHRQVYRWPRERHSTFASHALLYKTLGLLDPDSERKRHIHAQSEEDSKSVETPSAKPFETQPGRRATRTAWAVR